MRTKTARAGSGGKGAWRSKHGCQALVQFIGAKVPFGKCWTLCGRCPRAGCHPGPWESSSKCHKGLGAQGAEPRPAPPYLGQGLSVRTSGASRWAQDTQTRLCRARGPGVLSAHRSLFLSPGS